MKTGIERLKNALEFTRIYKENRNDKYLREARCLDFQLKHVLAPLTEEDGIAGRFDFDFLNFSTQMGGQSAQMASNYTYCFRDYEFTKAMQEAGNSLSFAEREQLYTCQAFWHEESTGRKLEIETVKKLGYVPPTNFRGPGAGSCLCRVSGANVDMEKLIKLGFDGLEKEIREKAALNGESTFYESLLICIDSFRDVCEMYAGQAEAISSASEDAGVKARFERMSNALRSIAHRAPTSFYEGVQLMWIYSVASDLMNYGRMDDYLGDLYVHDIDTGVITESEALEIILYLYKRFKEINKIHDCRVIIGGKGRKHPENADRLAMLIMEASRIFRETVPQLTLRYYKGMSEEVFAKAIEVNGEGTTFPIIYSDETNIPAVMELYGISEEDAERCVPYGCGEYVITGKSLGTPNSVISTLKALEMTLHNGVDYWHNVDCGTRTGEVTEFDTFDKLYDAFIRQITPVIDDLAVFMYLNYRVAGDQAPHLHLSLLMDDCIGRGKALLDGGIEHLYAASEIYSIVSCADSLTAIKKLVYDENRLTLKELVDILDSDFEGHEDIRKLCLNAPKYGNDDDEADAMAVKLFSDIADLTFKAGEKAGLEKYAMVSVNNSKSSDWGSYHAASADGRKSSSTMSNANGAAPGADKAGITALLKSMTKFDHTKHAGVINNVRFSKELFESSPEKVGMLLKAFYENGGTQTNICVVGRGELEAAMKEPEKYGNLMVRIGGFSARFVTLNPVLQKEILNRTTY